MWGNGGLQRQSRCHAGWDGSQSRPPTHGRTPGDHRSWDYSALTQLCHYRNTSSDILHCPRTVLHLAESVHCDGIRRMLVAHTGCRWGQNHHHTGNPPGTQCHRWMGKRGWGKWKDKRFHKVHSGCFEGRFDLEDNKEVEKVITLFYTIFKVNTTGEGKVLTTSSCIPPVWQGDALLLTNQCIIP